jgi:teichuronic acid biosynthesis glycosyltransferase TuaC
VSRIRVLVLSRSYPSDVFPTLGLWIAQPTRLLADRFEVRVVSPVPWCPPLPRLAGLEQYRRFRDVPRAEVRDDVGLLRPRFVAGPGRSLYPLEAVACWRGVRRTVESLRERFPFDLVHAHFIYPEGAVAHRIARRHGVPFVVTEHAPWHPWLEQASVRRQAVPAAEAAAALVAVSRWVGETMTRYADVGAKVRVVPNGVDLDRFAPDPHRRRDPDLVLAVGVLTFMKGLDVLIEAMRIVRARRPAARLVVVGGHHYRHTRLQGKRIRALAAPLGDAVAFVGQVPHDEVAGWMRSAAVLALASRAESFGSVLVEALACGTPVVATRSGGPEDVVTPEVGRLVPREDPTALAEALLEVLAAPERYPPEVLRRHAARFAWPRVAERVAAVYREVLDAPSRAPAAARGAAAGGLP